MPDDGAEQRQRRHGRQARPAPAEKLLDVRQKASGRRTAEKASDIKFEKIERGSIPRFCKVLNARSDVSCLLYIWQGIAFVGYGEDAPEDEAEDHPLQRADDALATPAAHRRS